MIQLTEIQGLYLKAEYCGSRVTCDPPPTDTDLDILVLTLDEHRLHNYLINNGWELGGSRIVNEANWIAPNERFTSYTKVEVNLIVTESPVFYENFSLATKVCKHINLMFKDHRIALFQALLYRTVPK